MYKGLLTQNSLYSELVELTLNNKVSVAKNKGHIDKYSKHKKLVSNKTKKMSKKISEWPKEK